MNSELKSLYQRTVLEHSRSPRNFHALKPADRMAEGFNPLCGDKVTVYLRETHPQRMPDSRNGTTIADISFEAAGCALCLASGSMMMELLKGIAESEARQRAERVLAAFAPGSEDALDSLGDIVALGSVRAYPSRTRCVTLPWRTLAAALDGETQPVSTE
ncbi:Fe-S cluster assembly sulfur transfer protein SufU [Candidatus Foliamicus sp.]